MNTQTYSNLASPVVSKTVGDFFMFSSKRPSHIQWVLERATTTMAPSKEVNEMHGTNTRIRAVDVELIEALTAISVVSKRLARKLMILADQSQHMEGGKADEQNGRYGRVYRGTAQRRCCD